MKLRGTFVLALALALASAACQPAAGPEGLSDDDVAAINGVADSFRDAVLAGDWAGAAAVFTADAVRLPPNAPLVQGREAIQAAMEAEAYTYTAFTNPTTEIVGSGDVAYARGTYSITVAVAGMPEPVSDTGKYVATFRKQADGSWLGALDIWNSDLPPQSMESGM
ncbi:MAG: SgcJ/EcaC family oxidoreductase [Gemmatimonadota bacterium]|nr:MAG: SgcJ/EcaC family oxidoreductase [Gemmatimonadota bacterium]